MDLIAIAETAQDVGSALSKFLDHVADHSADITALIAQCFSTSSALRKLDKAIKDLRPQHRVRKLHYISEDISIAQRSLQYTFDDVQRLIGRLGGGTVYGATFRRVWTELHDFFFEESGNPLSRRLEHYQRLLCHLTDTLVEGFSRDPDDFEDTRDRIERLFHEQDNRLADELHRVSLGVPHIPKPPSFERNRPRGQLPTQPQSPPPVSPRAGGRRRRPTGPQSPPMEYDFDRRRERYPPAPEPFDSSTTATASTSSSSRSSDLYSLPTHWLPHVFDQSRPTESFKVIGQGSISFGEDQGPEASRRLADEYVKLLEVPFENGDLVVRLYQRSDDLRSRIFIRTLRPARNRKDCCLPLAHIEVQRDGPFLKLMRLSNPAPRLWASLKFLSYEHMVLFFCSFLALRSEDSKANVTSIPDSELRSEKELFGGLIVDDHYQHGLRLYKDRESRGIRLQASVLRGELKKTPVWTAFITHQVQSRTWMTRGSSKVIHLADLQRFVFTDNYNPQTAPDGKHELSFVKASDADEFWEVINELFD